MNREPSERLKELVRVAIARLKLHEPKEGYYLAFSGGKDSCVVLDLLQKSGVKYDAHYAVTTVDPPPQLVRFIQKVHPEIWAAREKARTSMWKLIVQNGTPPTRLMRYCCRRLKEVYGKHRTIVTGVRKSESTNRKNRELKEECTRWKKTFYIHPIIDWEEDDVWEYIDCFSVPYCELYNQGYNRVGCIACPYKGKEGMIRDLNKFPEYKELYLRAFDKMLKRRREKGLPTDWESAEEVLLWWVNGKNRLTDEDKKMLMYGLELTEEDV